MNVFVSTEAYDFACGSHDAYTRLADPVIHRRRVVFVKAPGYWVVVDDLLGAAKHRVDVCFQFARLNLKCLASGWVEAMAASGNALLVRAYAGGPLGLRVAEGSTFPIEGWVSPDYGQRQPAPVLVYSLAQQLPCRILTVLFPTLAAAAAKPPRVTPSFNSDGAPSGVALEGAGHVLRFDEDLPRIEEVAPCGA